MSPYVVAAAATMSSLAAMALVGVLLGAPSIFAGAPSNILNAKNAPSFFFLIKDSFFPALHSCH